MSNSKQHLMFEEPVYEEVDGDGNPIVKNKKGKKMITSSEGYARTTNHAREPKTDLQRKALQSCGANEFISKVQHDAFKKVEQLSLGATDSHYVYLKWIEMCIGAWKTANTPIVKRPLDHLIKWMSNEEKRREWMAKNSKKLIANRKTEELGKLKSLVVSTSSDVKDELGDEDI